MGKFLSLVTLPWSLGLHWFAIIRKACSALPLIYRVFPSSANVWEILYDKLSLLVMVIMYQTHQVV